MHIALYQPDIPQNVGTIIRLAACMDVPLEIIEPCGFPFSIKALRRAAMDYADIAQLAQHPSFIHFNEWRQKRSSRLILVTTKTERSYLDFSYSENDILLFGRESAGVPADVHEIADEKITIPMHAQCRSLNIAVSAGIVVGEALRQIRYQQD